MTGAAEAISVTWVMKSQSPVDRKRTTLCVQRGRVAQARRRASRLLRFRSGCRSNAVQNGCIAKAAVLNGALICGCDDLGYLLFAGEA